MRIAVCSNLFPPVWIGGYEIGAAAVVRELQRRGHNVLLLTAARVWIGEEDRFECREQPHDSRHDFIDVGPCILGPLARLSAWRIPSLVLAARAARSRYRSALKAFAPDLVLLFNPLGLLAPLPADLLRWGRDSCVPVRFYVSDSWLADWPRAHPLLRLLERCPAGWIRRLLATAISVLGLGSRATPEPEQALFCSRYLRDVTPNLIQQLKAPLVIPWGVAELDHNTPLPLRHFQGTQPLSLVYAGQIQPHKGLDLLLQALAGRRKRCRLAVVGDERTPYAAQCRQQARQLALDRQIDWVGPVPRVISPGSCRGWVRSWWCRRAGKSPSAGSSWRGKPLACRSWPPAPAARPRPSGTVRPVSSSIPTSRRSLPPSWIAWKPTAGWPGRLDSGGRS